MNAARALKAARAAGVCFTLDGDKLVLGAATPPADTLIDALSRHKAEIVRQLHLAADGRSAEDWQGFFDERAGIAEFDGGLPRDRAEARALDSCVAEWLDRNPMRSLPGHCIGCGGQEHAHDPLLLHGIESVGHAWLHSRCWPAWCETRKAKAVAALAVMGLAAPVSPPMEPEQRSICLSSETRSVSAPWNDNLHSSGK